MSLLSAAVPASVPARVSVLASFAPTMRRRTAPVVDAHEPSKAGEMVASAFAR
jgi:hypothetical protein